jgi:hypothetical protein
LRGFNGGQIMTTQEDLYSADFTTTIEDIVSHKFNDAEIPTFELVFEHDEAEGLFFVETAIPPDEVSDAAID